MLKFIIYLIKFFLNKTLIFDKIIKKNNFNYPHHIRLDVKKISKKLKYDSYQKKTHHKYQPINIFHLKNKEDSIELASTKVSLADKKIYNKISYDLENIEALYRLSWIIKDLEKNNFEYFNYDINFILDDHEIKFKKLFYNAYTISERLEIISLYCSLSNTTLSIKNIKIFKSHINFLLNNLEYNIYDYNNHLFKNFKSLYIAGLFIGDVNISNTFKKYIVNKFDDFVDDDSFLNEGSSHYIFLFYKWCFDILLFSNLYLDTEMYEFILSKINRMNKSIGIFFLKNELQFNEFLAFGDNSPDYNLDFIKSYINFILKFTNEKNTSLNFTSKKEINTEISSWIRKDIYNSIIISRKINLKKIFYHEHKDFFHFIYSYKNNFIFVDSGNKDYNEGSKRYKYKSLKSHNSISIEKFDYKNKWSLLFDTKSKYYINLISNDKINYIFKNNKLEINRIIQIMSNGFILTDNFNMIKNSKEIQVTFQLNPNLKIVRSDTNNFMLTINKFRFNFSVQTKYNCKINIKENFYSANYGLEVKKKCISIIYKNLNKFNTTYILEEII